MAATLKGERLRATLRQELVQLQKASSASEDLNAVLPELSERLRNDAPLRSKVLAAAQSQLSLRQAFAASDFDQVLSLGSETSPDLASNETVLLMFLSSARMKDREAQEVWVRELKRRYPNQDVYQWARTLTDKDGAS